MSILISPIHFQTFCADELYIIIIHLLTSNRESGGWKDEKNDQKHGKKCEQQCDDNYF